MTQAHLDERALQLTNAMDRASQAGKTADVAKLQEVLADEGPYELLCVVRALLKKIKQRVLVGDAVDVLGIDWVDRRAMVETVHTRRSSLVDPPVANVDHALLVFALERPPLEAKQLTRFLVSMEATGVPFTLVLNKCDLCDETTRADWGARLEQWGYYPRFVSVATGEGVDELEAELAVGMSHNRALDGRGDGVGSIDDDDDEDEEDEGRTSDTGVAPRSVTVLAGPSGVGKSSLINRLRAGSKLAEALAAAGELLAQILDEDLLDAEHGGLGARRLQVLALAEVGGEGHHLASVGVLQPAQDDRGVEPAGIGEDDLLRGVGHDALVWCENPGAQRPGTGRGV